VLATVFEYAGTMLSAVCGKTKLETRLTWRLQQRNCTIWSLFRPAFTAAAGRQWLWQASVNLTFHPRDDEIGAPSCYDIPMTSGDGYLHLDKPTAHSPETCASFIQFLKDCVERPSTTLLTTTSTVLAQSRLIGCQLQKLSRAATVSSSP
jgi:hypothetical protein